MKNNDIFDVVFGKIMPALMNPIAIVPMMVDTIEAKHKEKQKEIIWQKARNELYNQINKELAVKHPLGFQYPGRD